MKSMHFVIHPNGRKLWARFRWFSGNHLAEVGVFRNRGFVRLKVDGWFEHYSFDEAYKWAMARLEKAKLEPVLLEDPIKLEEKKAV